MAEVKLIDANALETKAYSTRPATWDDPNGGSYVVNVEDIENAPTIDPESLRPCGKWEKRQTNVGEETYCTACGKEAEILQDGGGCELLSDYCPHCGAKMMEV